MQILYLGMREIFSALPFQALIHHGFAPAALITPQPHGLNRPFRKLNYPISENADFDHNIFEIAKKFKIPNYEIGDMKSTAALNFLAALKPSFIIVACFPKILPAEWLQAPRYGSLNLHPSMLPAYRGPTPLEDQLANAEKMTGVTLHFMNETADSGDIIAQQSILIPQDATLDELNRLTAAVGGELLIRTLLNPEEIPRRPQEPG